MSQLAQYHFTAEGFNRVAQPYTIACRRLAGVILRLQGKERLIIDLRPKSSPRSVLNTNLDPVQWPSLPSQQPPTTWESLIKTAPERLPAGILWSRYMLMSIQVRNLQFSSVFFSLRRPLTCLICHRSVYPANSALDRTVCP